MLSFIKTTVALVNAMIGSAVLILPIMFVENGIIIYIAILLLTGICTCYSSIICLDHMADQQDDFKDTLCRHSKNKDQFPWFVMFLFLSTQLFLFIYFNFIMKQWNGLFYRTLWLLPYLPYATLITLLIFILSIKKFHLGITLMALGIVSVIVAIFFMGWMFLTRPSTHIKQIQFFQGRSITDLITLFIGAFSIQTIFVQVLRAHPVAHQRIRIAWAAYFIGGAVYLYFGVIGGYGIVDRIPVFANAKTIMGYFYGDRWQPFILQLIYLVHLYSVWPQFANINSLRILQILDIEEQEWKKNLYLLISPCVAFGLYMLEVNLTTFINLNGGICLFFAVFAIPIFMHVKCRYFNRLSIQYSQPHDFNPIWISYDKECQKKRVQQTSCGKITDATILIIMSVYGVTSLILTLKHTFLDVHQAQN